MESNRIQLLETPRRLITQYSRSEEAFIRMYQMFLPLYKEETVSDNQKQLMIQMIGEFYDHSTEMTLDMFDIHILPYFDSYLHYESKFNSLLEAIIEALPLLPELEIKLGQLEKRTFEFTGEWKTFYKLIT